MASPFFSNSFSAYIFYWYCHTPVATLVRSLYGVGEEGWLLYPKFQLAWLGALSAWSLIVRIGLRRGLLSPELPNILLLAS